MPAQRVSVEREAVHGDLTIKQLESGTIEIWKNGGHLEPARPTLLAICNELGLETNYLSGTQLNTREMGKRIIDAIGNKGA